MDINEEDSLLRAVELGDVDEVRRLLQQDRSLVNCTSWDAPLNYACEKGHLEMVRMLISEFGADRNAEGWFGGPPICSAARNGKKQVLLTLINEFGCDPTIKGWCGRSPLHNACASGNVSLVRTLIRDFKADINARDNNNNLPINLAATLENKEVVLTLIKEFRCDINIRGQYGRSLLHNACQSGNVSLIRNLIRDHKTSITARDNDQNMPIHIAAICGKDKVVLALINEFGCDPTVKGQFNRSLLHCACESGEVRLVQSLKRFSNFTKSITAKDSQNNPPIHVAACNGKGEVALTLLKKLNCDSTVKGQLNRSLLHSACKGGSNSLVRALVCDFKASIMTKDEENNFPIHLAAYNGNTEVVLTLIKEFDCDPNIKGHFGRSFLHLACEAGKDWLIRRTRHLISPLVVDDDGDTPLHICASRDHSWCVGAMLEMNAPILVKNKSGKSPLDVARSGSKHVLEAHIAANKDKIRLDYKDIQRNAKKKYAGEEHLTRLFVIGNSGSGKSSLIEALKWEGFFDWFWKVSKSHVPPHTAGIVPYTHNSKHCGRVLFYDFAGETEYYSSHAAILENIAKSKKGDNIFVLVVNLKESSNSVNNILHYWVSFIQHLNFDTKRSSLIIIGSHLDVVSKEISQTKGDSFRDYCHKFKSLGDVQNASYFLLDCCQPQSKELKDLQNNISGLIANSPRYQLSLHASTLLGMLEKDFSQVAACTVQTVLSHIEVTGIALPSDITGLLPILHELHEIGLLFFMAGNSARQSSLVVRNITQLTNEVHKLLFSPQAKQNLKKYIDNEDMASFNVGILPEKILPSSISQN